MDWSATAVDFNGAKAYLAWHSNKQATKPAEAWGGAVDIIEPDGENELAINVTAMSDLLKFNHVLYDNNKLFLASTSLTEAGTVGRIVLENGEFEENASVDIIGFPGVSVNAVVKANDDQLVAVSGYAGTYGTFAPNADARSYYYGEDEEKAKNNVVTALVPYDNDFGGKYVTTDEAGDVYVLHNTKSAQITKVGGKTVDLGVGLLSAMKKAESYDPVTEELVFSAAEHDYYGKHVFAVKDGIAYVACGKNGLVVCDVNTGDILWKSADDENEHIVKATGVCVAGNYVYVVTEVGLRVYDWVESKGEKVFHLYAFEVEEYENGLPVSNDPAATGTEERHSPNFVAVNPTTNEIYVVYGQSGVRVYKFREVEE